MDHYTKKALWIYWIRGDDEVELTDEEFSDNEDEVAEVFRIDTNIFDFETPMCKAFKEFNYLLQIDPDLLTKDIEGFKTYDEYKDDWIYEWNRDNDGHCNRGNLPGAYIVGNSLHYQDYEWYDALINCELKEQALRNKAIMEGSISDEESSNDGWKRWESHEITYHDHDENETHGERQELYEEYVAVKEYEYDDLAKTSDDACRAYQEIFRKMDEGWMDDWEVDRYGNANLVITKYLVNISKRRAFWSLNEDILKITILTTNTPYPSRKIRRIRACTHQRPQRKPVQYAVSSEDQYAVLEIYAGWPVAELRGGGMGERVGRGGRGRRPRGGNDERVEELNGQGNDQGLGANGNVEGVNGVIGKQGNVGNQNGNVVNENVQENVRNVLVNGNQIEKMESVQDMIGCSIDQKVKYTTSLFVGKALTWWNSQIRTLSQEVASRKIERYMYGLAQQICGKVVSTEPKTMQKAVQISGALTDEAVRNESIKKVEKEEMWGNLARIRMVRGNQGNQAKGRAFMLLEEEARQDPNIVMGTFTLNNHFATTLFDSGADYSFVSTTFIPLLGIEPSELGFRYEIEIASGQLVEIDKVIKGCTLEIKGHVFDIDLIPLGHRSFDVIIGMDWLSNHKAEIICHEKVVRIPLLDGKVLRVLGERPEEKARLLMSVKASDKKQGEIVVVRDFLEVFPDDLSGLPPLREIEFRIELIPGVVPIAMYPYHLAPFELEELSG
ncbi:putative reverse transcriptase domain-containing protein [Tanacetum coccineum]